jgi:hypothetical protein
LPILRAMKISVETTEKKALAINLDNSIYGTFAEIGAGQEVARQFFQAGLASNTVAKTMSAYDMTISDEIYGKSSRYVCEDRIEKMLSHEYQLLQSRLSEKRGSESRFFAFADTVTTSNRKRGYTKSHGWMGIQWQSKIGGPVNKLILHCRLWDSLRLQQQEALAVLGVNLLHAAYFHLPPSDDPCAKVFISKLLDNLSNRRIEIDLIRFSGDELDHVDNRLAALQLVGQSHTEAVMFDASGEVQLLSDELFKASPLVLRGTFRPITKTNVEILERSKKEFKCRLPEGVEQKVFAEMTMSGLVKDDDGDVDIADFLDRVDTITALGYSVLISNFTLFHQVRSYLRTCTRQHIAMVVGASLLDKIFDESFYGDLPSGMLEAFSRLFDANTQLLVFPYKTEQTCLTAKTYFPQGPVGSLYKYLIDSNKITDISNCDDLDMSFLSTDIRKMLQSSNEDWKDLVPEAVRDMIVKKKLFGLK